MGTIQFNNSLFLAKQGLIEQGFTNIVIPQEKPRSAGEVLGCTSPQL
jgi:2-(3-amino-3-carboxypropyl)histidine synthase